jgi:hypothetical protein
VIGAAYRSRAVQAVLGPSRSPLIPSVLWLGWLDEDGELVAMSGTTAVHEAFAPLDDGVTNVVSIDAGAAGPGWTIAGVGLFDAASGGDLVVSAALDAPVSPAEDAPLSFALGELVFTVMP